MYMHLNVCCTCKNNAQHCTPLLINSPIQLVNKSKTRNTVSFHLSVDCQRLTLKEGHNLWLKQARC